jgi:copper chaperone CopZ
MQTYYLTVAGVTSSKRMNEVAEVLNTLPGVGAATVSPLDGELTIHFNERRTCIGELTSAVEEAGYRIDNAGSTHRSRARNSHVYLRAGRPV